MLNQNPKNPFHRHGPGLTGNIAKVPHRRVVLIYDMVRNSRIPAQIQMWREADQEVCGRPKAMTDIQVLVVMLILAFEGSALAFLRGAEMLAGRFHTKSLELLEIEPLEGTAHQQIRTWNNRLQRSFHNIVAVTDPYPGMRWALLTNKQWDEIEANLDQDRKLEMWRRLDWLCNELISLCWQTGPSLLEQWEGNLTIDATAFGVFSKNGHNSKSMFRSSYARAGWYLRTANHQLPQRGSQVRKAIFGFEVHLVAAASNDGNGRDDPYPHLVLSMSFGRPSRIVSHLGLKAIQFAHRRHWREDWHQPLVIGDRGYFANSKPESLQLPVRALGYRIMTDYRDEQLGDRHGYAGAMQIEGAFYCPGMPPYLRDATKNVRAKRISKEVWRNYIASRKPYLLRRKELPAPDGSVKFMCPALGPNATVSCPIRDAQPGFKTRDVFRDRHGNERTLIPIVPSNASAPLEQGAICKNKSSVKFPIAADAKFIQSLLFGTEE